MVRNPLAILVSWNSLNVEFRKGRSSPVEAFAPDLSAELDAIPDMLDRQIRLLCWMFEKIRMLPPSQIIRYEDLY